VATCCVMFSKSVWGVGIKTGLGIKMEKGRGGDKKERNQTLLFRRRTPKNITHSPRGKRARVGWMFRRRDAEEYRSLARRQASAGWVWCGWVDARRRDAEEYYSLAKRQASAGWVDAVGREAWVEKVLAAKCLWHTYRAYLR
jgi:hypothetical protein